MDKNDSNFNLVQIDPHVVDITIENKEKLILPNKAEENKKQKSNYQFMKFVLGKEMKRLKDYKKK